MTLFAILALGFFLGMRHATDSDHVIAVSTIVSRERSPLAAVWVGALWGLGHTATILAVGGAIVVFGWIIPPRLGLSMELSVAVMLVALGVFNLSGAWSHLKQVAHRHRHDGGAAELALPYSASGARGMLRPLAVGVVHGLAGSAAIALLVLGTIRSAGMAIFYLAVFSTGTLAGMMLLTLLMALPISAVSKRFPGSDQLLSRALGLVSIAFGLFLAYRIGITDGLLVGAPNWDPH